MAVLTVLQGFYARLLWGTSRSFHTTKPKAVRACLERMACFVGKEKMPLTVNLKDKKITPLYVDAAGNTFYLYDLIPFGSAEWETARQTIHAIAQQGDVDDALVLRKVAEDADRLIVKMHVLEPDGSEADFCGNGARSVGAYLQDVYGKHFRDFALSSRRGLHPIRRESDMSFVNMGKPIIAKLDYRFTFEGTAISLTFADAVEPHLVTLDLRSNEQLKALGDAINKEWKAKYPHGVNVNWVRPTVDGISVTTYERGLWRLTKACGTGSTASCAVAVAKGWLPEDRLSYEISVPGGRLKLLRGQEGDLWLGGPVVFKQIEVERC